MGESARCDIGSGPGEGFPAAVFLASISLLSASALTYEVLLLRLFSFTLGHHFAATAISLALLGYGASGTALTLAQGALRGRLATAYPLGCGLFGLTAPAAYALAQRLPFTPMAAVWDPAQWGIFAAVYLVLSAPFFFAGGCVGFALRELRQRVPQVYRADLLGAGAGALAGVGLLFVLPPAECLRVVGLGGFVAGALAAGGDRAPRRRRFAARPWVYAAIGLCCALAWPAPWLEARLSEYQGLALALRAPEARVVAESWSPLGHLAAVASPRVPFRHAPGLSLTCPWPVPEQIGLFLDGEFSGTVDAAGEERYRECLPTALAYRVLAPGPRVLVLGSGGGGDVRVALESGAKAVDAVELDPRLPRLLAGPLGAFAGPVYGVTGVRLHLDEARAFVAASREEYDLIQLALPDSFAGFLSGSPGSSESFLYTVEAFGAFLGRLAPGGLLAVTRWLETPPRESLKLFATAAEALCRRGVEAPGSRLALVRTWNTVTLLVRGRPFGAGEHQAIRDFCREQGFDIAWLADFSPREADRFHGSESPSLHEGASEILSGRRDAFFRQYKFFIEPATDDRPYFSRTFKWGTLAELLGARGRGGAALVEWGSLLASATLGQAVLLGGVLILLPLRALRRRTRGSLAPARVALYFGALGLAFLLVEVTTIQRLTLLLGHPVYAAAATLGCFLVFAGLGSEASGRCFRNRTCSGAIGLAIGAAVGLALAYQAAFPWLFPHLAALPLAVRGLLATGFLAPLAFFMGMPFPLGLGALAGESPDAVPWAWAVNGFASVVGAALAALLAVHVGFSGVAVIACGCYLLAAVVAPRWSTAA